MAERFINPVPQYLDDSGDPAVEGKLYFYDTGTVVFKDTFADSDGNIANSNPVLLNADGSTPNIFLEGVYKVIRTSMVDGNEVQDWERDPVGGNVVGQGADWDATKSYSVGDITKASDNRYYESTTNNNVGNDPVLGDPWGLSYISNANLIESSGQTRDILDEDQEAKAVAHYAAAGDFYTDAGIADAYVFSAVGLQAVPPVYTDGMVFRAVIANTNTGASTCNPGGLGIKDIKLNGGTDPVAGDLEVDKEAKLRYDSGNDWLELTNPVVSGDSDNFSTNFLHVRDEKTNNTEGGSSLAGANTRVLNTVLTNEISGASLSSNQLTLPAGDYYVEARAPNNSGNRNKAYLYNVTDAADIIVGSSEVASSTNGDRNQSFVTGKFTLAAEKDVELRHYIQTAKATDGLGRATNSGQIEVYAEIKLWKVA